MHKYSTRLFGLLLLLSFLSYAVGIGLMEVVQHSQPSPLQIGNAKANLITGAVLIIIIHTLFNFGLLIIMFNILKQVSRNFSLIYLLLGVFATLMLSFGALFLLLTIPMGETINQANHLNTFSFSSVRHLASRVQFYCYQFGMILWACGGLFLCYLLQQKKMVPVLFPLMGYIGYLIFIMGCILELYGKSFGIIISLPGGLFEVLLSSWFIIYGYKNAHLYRYKQNFQNS